MLTHTVLRSVDNDISKLLIEAITTTVIETFNAE